MTSEDIPLHRTVDSDIAITEIAERDPEARLLGLGGGDMRHHMTFGDQIQHARYGNGGALGQVEYVQTAIGPGPSDHRNVVASGMWLFRYGDHPVAVRMQGAAMQMGGRPSGRLDVLAVDSEVARELVTEVRRLMDERSVIRGQVVTFGSRPLRPGHGRRDLHRAARRSTRPPSCCPTACSTGSPTTSSAWASTASGLAAHGQHLKRGVLLYGPPGTGKTHTVRYLLSATPGTTAVLLSGGSLRFIHDAAKVARAHQPAIVVLEDCDLVAEDRSFGRWAPRRCSSRCSTPSTASTPTPTWRSCSRRTGSRTSRSPCRSGPGRVDLAAEIPLPGRATAGSSCSASMAATSSAPRRCRPRRARAEGTTASFAKELVRRAVLAAAVERRADPADEHLAAALDELLSDSAGADPQPARVRVRARQPGFGPGMQPGPFPSFGPGGF